MEIALINEIFPGIIFENLFFHFSFPPFRLNSVSFFGSLFVI